MILALAPASAITTGYTFTDGETVTAAKMNQSVNSATIGPSEVQTSMIADSAITTAKINNLSIDYTKLIDGGITPVKFAPLNTMTVETVIDSANDYVPYYSNADGGNRRVTVANLQGNFSLPTGMVMPYAGSSAPTGWVMCDGKTIGNVASAATERANADTQNLYTQLWNAFDNTRLHIQDPSGTPTVRGANATADYNANKRMPLPDLRDRAVYGLGNMGGSDAALITASGTGNPGVDGTILGNNGGVDRYTLTQAQLPAYNINLPFTLTGGGAGAEPFIANDGTNNVAPATISSGGSGNAHPILNPAIILLYIIKL